MADAPVPACAGMWALFDSTDLSAHRVAKRRCERCPILAECSDLLRQELSVGRAIQEAGGGPRGTWAGRLVGKGERPPAARCGTDSGYFRHRRRGDDACDECKAAHNAFEIARLARKAAS